MGSIDILNLAPTTISKDLRGKYILLYGKPKVGKTTFAAEAPKNLLLAFEKGYNAISGIMAIDMNTWSDFKKVLKQLRKPESKEKFDSITIDTIDIMWTLCEKYICAQAGVETIGEIEWGKGYAQAKEEFAKVLREITMLGYGLIIIAHVSTRFEKVADSDDSIEIISPSIQKRPYEIVNPLVDIIGYIDNSFLPNGDTQRLLRTRATKTLMAGSRFKHLKSPINFGYNELVEALSQAIDASVSEDGAIIVDKTVHNEIAKRPFEDTMAEAGKLWEEIYNKDNDNLKIMTNLVELAFASPMRLSEATEKNQDVVEMVIEDLKELSAKQSK
jgi:hypothetical protein